MRLTPILGVMIVAIVLAFFAGMVVQAMLRAFRDLRLTKQMVGVMRKAAWRRVPAALVMGGLVVCALIATIRILLTAEADPPTTHVPLPLK